MYTCTYDPFVNSGAYFNNLYNYAPGPTYVLVLPMLNVTDYYYVHTLYIYIYIYIYIYNIIYTNVSV